jgi:hypothetical protein
MTHLCAAKMHSRPDRSTYEVDVCTVSVCSPSAKFLFDVSVFLSAPPLSEVLSDVMGVEVSFLTRTVSGSGAGPRFSAVLTLGLCKLGDSIYCNK